MTSEAGFCVFLSHWNTFHRVWSGIYVRLVKLIIFLLLELTSYFAELIELITATLYTGRFNLHKYLTCNILGILREMQRSEVYAVAKLLQAE